MHIPDTMHVVGVTNIITDVPIHTCIIVYAMNHIVYLYKYLVV